MAQGDSGIVAAGVRRAFGAVQAVDGLDLEARPGEVTALIGPNGAGKTTLILMLATLLVPDSGTIRINGIDPVATPQQVRAVMGWMPDSFGTWDALTAREVLETYGAAYRLDAATARSRAEELLDLVHLSEFANQPARVLSRGQKQRLGLARALVNHPSVLLLDEPASGLDPRSRIELRDLLRTVAAQGATVLVSSHILTELQEIADRAVIVARGRTVGTQDLRANGGAPQAALPRQWRIRALDPPLLLAALQHYAVPHRQQGDVVEAQIQGDAAAAALLGDLVRGGVPIVEYAPSFNTLESAYLAATEDRR
jgi:ABC-2 type transport system ATP-binding protein